MLVKAFLAAVTRISRRARRIRASEVEQLLGGGSVSADRRALANLLARAAAPAGAEEIARLDAAVDAFMPGRREPLPVGSPVVPARGAGRRSGAAKRGSFGRGAGPGPLRLTVSVAALAIVAAGVIVATGNLPAPAQHSVHGFLAAVGLVVPDRPRASGQSSASPSASGPENAVATRSSAPVLGGSSPGTTSPILVPLCQAYLSGTTPGIGMASADLDRLAAAADGRDNIEAFCTRLLSRQSATPTPTPTTSPSKKANPAGTDGKQQCHGNGKKACPTPSG